MFLCNVKLISDICTVEPFGKCSELFRDSVQSANVTKICEISKLFIIKIVMAIKRPKIKVPAGAIEKIMQATGAGKTSVYDALNYKTFTDAAKRIRHEALLHGGVETKDVVFN